MANSAGDARGSELDIRRELVKSGTVDAMVSVGSNFFYTVTLPCTLWFFDRGKAKTDRKKKVVFIDARHIFTQIDRAHREFTPQQIEFISNIVRSFAQHACSGSDNISASASPLRRRSRRSGPLGMLTLTHFHKISRAEGPTRQYKRRTTANLTALWVYLHFLL